MERGEGEGFAVSPCLMVQNPEEPSVAVPLVASVSIFVSRTQSQSVSGVIVSFSATNWIAVHSGGYSTRCSVNIWYYSVTNFGRVPLYYCHGNCIPQDLKSCLFFRVDPLQLRSPKKSSVLQKIAVVFVLNYHSIGHHGSPLRS